jgi:hypothetical protein
LWTQRASSFEENMKLRNLLGWSSALCLSAIFTQAQETSNADKVEAQIKQLQNKFEKQQQEMRQIFERMLREQQQQIEELKKQISASTNAPIGQAETNQIVQDQLKELSDRTDSIIEAQKKVRPGEFNPAIGLVGETIFSYQSRASNETGSERPGGFNIFQRSVELNISAAVDPFAKAYAVINASADAATGEATMGVEEAALQTTSLPWNFELKAGRFFGEFGKLSYIHDHELPFVNRPLALDQYIGGESRTDGAQLSWLPPLPHYLSVVAGVGNGFGGDSPLNNPGLYRTLGGFNYFGRISTYFDLTPNIQLETGISGLINPTTHDRGGNDAFTGPGGVLLTEKQRQVAGLDVKLSYVPLQNNQFKRLDWGTEVLASHSRYLFDPDGSLADGGPLSGDEFRRSIGSMGLYSYITYKWHRQWSAGFLFDYVQDPANHNIETLAYSPYITWAPSHWNQIRLQYTHTEPNSASGFKPDDAVYIQWAWIIGAHSHGWQAR